MPASICDIVVFCVKNPLVFKCSGTMTTLPGPTTVLFVSSHPFFVQVYKYYLYGSLVLIQISFVFGCCESSPGWFMIH